MNIFIVFLFVGVGVDVILYLDRLVFNFVRLFFSGNIVSGNRIYLMFIATRVIQCVANKNY